MMNSQTQMENKTPLEKWVKQITETLPPAPPVLLKPELLAMLKNTTPKQTPLKRVYNIHIVGRPGEIWDMSPSLSNSNGYPESAMGDGGLRTGHMWSCDNCGTDSCLCVANLIGSPGGFYSPTTCKDYGLPRKYVRRELDVLARRFYGAMVLAEPGNKRHTRIRSEIVLDIAEELCNAITLACAGEFRYSIHKGAKGLTRQTNADKLVKQFGMRRRGKFYNWQPRVHEHLEGFLGGGYAQLLAAKKANISTSGNERVMFAELFFQVVLRTYGRTTALRTLRNGFLWDGKYYSERLSVGYGGIAWAACAQVAYDYSRGRINPITFVDRAFDLQHNNATVFNKTHNVTTTFKYWLDARSEAGVEWLARWTPNDVREKFGLPKIVQIAPFEQLCHQDAPLPPDDEPITTEYINSIQNSARSKDQRKRRSVRAGAVMQSLAKLVHAEYLSEEGDAEEDRDEDSDDLTCTVCGINQSGCCDTEICDPCLAKE